MKNNNKLNLIALILIAVWVSYYLAVLLKTGFISDDAYNSQIKGSLLHEGNSLFQRISSETLGWITGAGRFFPLGFSYTYTLYYFIQSEIIIKSMTLVVILIGIMSFAAVVKHETNSWVAGLFAGLTIPLFFQFRNWHDPIIAFSALIPLLFMYTMGALALFQRYLVSQKKYQLYASLLLYLLALLTYEIPYPLGVLFLVVAYSHFQRVKPAIKISLPHLSLSLFFIGLMVALRVYFLYSQNLQSSYPGTELHSNLGRVWQAFIFQLSATFPLSYYFSTKEPFKLLLNWPDLIVISAFFAGICLLIIKMAGEKINPPARLRGLLMAGTSLLVLPALVISLSGHQDELIKIGYGMAYIQIYFQYFGLALILIACLIYVLRKLPAKFVVAFALIVGLMLSTIATINLGLNRAVAMGTNQTYLYPRKLLEEALKAGVMDGVKENALVLRAMRFPSDMTWFYSLVTGKKFNICNLNDVSEYARCLSKLPVSNANNQPTHTGALLRTERLDFSQQDVWILSYVFDKQHGKDGQLVLGKVDYIVQDGLSKNLIRVVVKKVIVFQQAEGKVHSLDFEKSPIDFLTISNFENQRSSSFDAFLKADMSAPDLDFRWLGGVFPPDGTEQSNVRWSSGTGELILYNFSKESQAVKLSMALGTPSPESSRVSIQHPEFKDTINVSMSPVNYSKSLILPPGDTTIKLTSDGKPFLNGDPRKIVFGILNFKLKKIKDDIEFQWRDGVFERDGTDQDNVRWSSGRGTLALTNYSDKTKAMKLSMGLSVPMHGSAKVFIQYPKSRETVDIKSQRVDYSKTVSLPPGETLIKLTSDGKPLLNGDPRKVVFGVHNFNLSRIKDDIELQWRNGIFDRDGTDQDNVRWSSGRGELVMHNYSNATKTIQLSMELGMPMPGSAKVYIQHPKSKEAVDIKAQRMTYSKTVTLPPGETIIKLSSDGKPFLNGDPRMIVFGIYNFKYSLLPQ
jgi:hypothetical protein